MHTDPHVFDAIIVGGSYAGLSAAMQLARARRKVLVIDGGQRRNRFARYSHGFLGQDGKEAAAIALEGKRQLLAYDTVTWRDGQATSANAHGDGFEVTAGDAVFHGRRRVLATGVKDQLPPLEGLAERWGVSVFHCPYCHGYELNQGRIGVLAAGPLSHHHAMMLPDWGQVTLLTNGAWEPDAEQTAALLQRGVVIERTPVRRISGHADVELESGGTLPMDGLFTLARTQLGSPLAEQLGCALDEGPMGMFIRTEMTKASTVPGVFACGDGARMMGNVALAVADGAMAGMGVHQSLIFAPH
jgi:thioredoxin reductase